MRIKRDNDDRGQALVLAMVFLVVAVFAAMVMAGMANRNNRQITHGRVEGQLLNAARAGLVAGKDALWNKFVNGGAVGNKAVYRGWLDANVTTNTDGTTQVHLSASGAWVTTPQTALSLGGSSDVKTAGRIDIAVSAARVDQQNSTFVYLIATATEARSGETRISETVMRMGGAPWRGFEYALLANNVNCVFCHADVDNVTRFYPGMGATEHNRIKVATLEALEMRVGEASSRIAGTLYASGVLQDKFGNELPTMPSGRGNIQSIPMDATTGKIQDNGWTNMEDLADSMSSQTPFGNFYKGYESSSTFDGEIPENFPPVIPYGDDRLVSNNEWKDKVVELQRGELSGGTISKFADTSGSFVAGGTNLLPRTGGEATYGSNTDEEQREHLVLVGTKDDPIRIRDDVAVNGDVIITGYVEGNGLLLARGNVYIVGDLIYNDGDTNGDGTGERTFGENAGLTNAWAIAAGGNIVHNNYNQDMTDKQVSGNNDEGNGTTGGFTTVEAGLFNRTEWAKTQRYLRANPTGAGAGDARYLGNQKLPTLTDDPSQALKYTSEDEAAGRIPAGKAVDDPIVNNAYVAGHVPRYYSMEPAATGGKVWVFNGPAAKADGSDGAYWDNTANGGKGMWKGREFSRYNFKNQNGDRLLNALDVSSLTPGVDYVNSAWNPSNDWFKQDDLFKMYMAEDDKRYAENGNRSKDFEIDGLLYTNNSIFMMSRGHNGWTGGRKVRSGGGKMIVNGAIVASDLAMLVAGQDNDRYGRGLKLNYDVRTSQYLTIEDTTAVGLTTVSRRER